jgi:maleylpyruvate isomerase
MTSVVAALVDLRTSTAALIRGIEAEQWTDADMRAPSLLPEWTRGHVLTHIARNADGIARTLAGALRGEVVARYPDGRAGRDADIKAGATRAATELIADVRESADRLDRVFGAVADADGWELPTEDRPAGDYAPARWREVEIHRVDLAGAYTPDEWPASFISYLLPVLVDTVPNRTDCALKITVTPDGSTTTDLPGSVWTVGSGEQVSVAGPDWALLAWLAGRSKIVVGVLSATPSLGPWS